MECLLQVEETVEKAWGVEHVSIRMKNMASAFRCCQLRLLAGFVLG